MPSTTNSLLAHTSTRHRVRALQRRQRRRPTGCRRCTSRLPPHEWCCRWIILLCAPQNVMMMMINTYITFWRSLTAGERARAKQKKRSGVDEGAALLPKNARTARGRGLKRHISPRPGEVFAHTRQVGFEHLSLFCVWVCRRRRVCVCLCWKREKSGVAALYRLPSQHERRQQRADERRG